jgi:hypothetical protein
MVGEGTWIRTDESEDVAASVRHALRCWAMTADDPQAWKWVVLALHSALQGACVCHLTSTAEPIGALTSRNTVEWLTYLEAARDDPGILPPKQTELMALPALLKAVRRAGSAGDGVSPAIAINSGEFNWLRRFHNGIRNQFVHFEPRGWAIEVSGMAGLAGLVSRIIADVLQAGWAFRHKGHAWRTALRADLERLAVLS